jgi:hypothetical protein
MPPIRGFIKIREVDVFLGYQSLKIYPSAKAACWFFASKKINLFMQHLITKMV